VSDSLIPISDEQAKLGQEIVKALRGLGGFFERALGSVPEDLVGYLGGDWLRTRRGENIVRVLYEARARLEARGIEDTRPATLSVALPILQGAADEDREEIVDLWARLLANAMDPKLGTVRARFIDAVKRMDPPDAIFLKYAFDTRLQSIHKNDSLANNGINQISRSLDIRQSALGVTISNVQALGFCHDAGPSYQLNSLFYEFMLACYPEDAKYMPPTVE